MRKEISAEFVNNMLQAVVFLEMAFDYFFEKEKITRVQYLAMVHIQEEGQDGMALSKLGEKMSVTRANITALVDRMEKAKLVQRVPDSSDRRSIKVKVLDRGIEICERILPQRFKFAEDVLRNITDNELKEVNEVLKKVYVDLHAQVKQLLATDASSPKSVTW